MAEEKDQKDQKDQKDEKDQKTVAEKQAEEKGKQPATQESRPLPDPGQADDLNELERQLRQGLELVQMMQTTGGKEKNAQLAERLTETLEGASGLTGDLNFSASDEERAKQRREKAEEERRQREDAEAQEDRERQEQREQRESQQSKQEKERATASRK